MPERLRLFFTRHPILRDAVLWAIPALLFAAFLRVLFLSYSPYAYWGSDSRSYFSFAHKLLTEGYISLDSKRRFIYPILMAPISALPGPPLKWVAIIQHLLGLLSLLPLAYVVRKTFSLWKVWIIPVTLLYAGWPLFLWYEHELLGETLVFSSLIWAMAGWVAWVKEDRIPRALSLFWWFFVPYAIVILTKPSSRFFWPGLFVGFLIIAGWRRMARPQWIATICLIVATLFVGQKKQGAWLAYVATFPLTQLDTPLHAEYKAEIRADVQKFKDNIDVYYSQDDWPFGFLENPDNQSERPLWQKLGKDEKAMQRIYTDLAVEGIKTQPMMFLYLGWQKLIASINPQEFKEDRFTSAFYTERFEDDYGTAKNKPDSPARFALGYGKSETLPEYPEFQQKLAPRPNSWMEGLVVKWVGAIEKLGNFVHLPEDVQETQRQIWKTRPTVLGIWLVVALLLALVIPRYRSTWGVWTFAALSYLAGVFLVSQVNPRYFAPAWPVLLPLMALPADALFRLIFRKNA